MDGPLGLTFLNGKANIFSEIHAFTLQSKISLYTLMTSKGLVLENSQEHFLQYGHKWSGLEQKYEAYNWI